MMLENSLEAETLNTGGYLHIRMRMRRQEQKNCAGLVILSRKSRLCSSAVAMAMDELFDVIDIC